MATIPKLTSMTTDEPQIRAIVQAYVQHHEARDVEKLMSLFTEDGCIMAPFLPLVQGKAGLRQHWAFDEFGQRNLEVDTTHVEVCGNTAFSLGTFKINVKMPTGKRIDDRGKWVAAMRRVGTTWKIVAHCFNSDLPITTYMT